MAATASTSSRSRHRQRPEHGADAEDGEIEAQQHIHRNLGRHGGEQRGNRGRRVGIGVRQPHVQRKQRELERDPDRDERKRRQHRALAVHVGEAHREVGQIERAGLEVQQADPDHEEGRADGAEDQVLVRRQQRAPVAAQRDQHIRRQRRDLEENEDVERVPGDGDAGQARQAQAMQRVEQIVLVARHLGRDAGPGERRDDRGDGAEEHQQECVGGIQPVLDAPGRRPAADLVAHDPVQLDLGEQHRARRRT